MVDNYDGWQIIEPLGEGGQGTVYKARSPKRVRALHNSFIGIASELRDIKDLAPDDLSPIEGLAKSIVNTGSPDPTNELGAVKIFKIPDGGNSEQKEKALARLHQEVKALKELQNPAILQLLHAPHMSAATHFIVTEYHSKGTLDKHLLGFKGRALESLLAFRPLVDVIVAIHDHGAIHRDIKTQNIFLATDGHLVLGDFGIVFFRDHAGTRYTETFGERVGSHYWMAPWAYEPMQLALEKVSPALDIYPLAKVLWSMVSGRDGFAYWEYTRPENNLEVLFPRDPAMTVINDILSKCIVRDEAQCLNSATELLELIDEASDEIRNAGQKPPGSRAWPCHVCGRGRYIREAKRTTIQYEEQPGILAGARGYSLFICDICKHCEFFRE